MHVKTKSPLTFDAATHSYFLDGQPIPGVTSVISSIISPVYNKDSDLMRRAAAFGTAVHKACELDDRGTLDIDILDPALLPYLEGWRKFVKAGFQTILSEDRVCSRKFRFAGTLDRVIAMNHTPTVYALLDIKTSTTIGPEVGVQTAAYVLAVEENLGIKIKQRLCIQLTKGNYKIHKLTDPSDRQIFIAALSCYNWRLKHGKQF